MIRQLFNIRIRLACTPLHELARLDRRGLREHYRMTRERLRYWTPMLLAVIALSIVWLALATPLLWRGALPSAAFYGGLGLCATALLVLCFLEEVARTELRQVESLLRPRGTTLGGGLALLMEPVE